MLLTRWLATAEKQRRFPRALESDISWLLREGREGREKGLRADLPGKLEYLWRAGNGHLQAQNDLFRLQHALHAVKLTGWIYMVLSENEWSGRRQLRLSSSVSGVYLRRSALETGFDEHGEQHSTLPVRITGDLAALDKLLQRSGWRRGAAGGSDEHQHLLLADGFSAE
ncbi:DUF2913 family protein [Pantoea vagans]|uniref:DUF2913 family protein n=1 Tax=Pantoea vagans TaxID=470934 RepID=UPI0023AFEF71|nr:DUF2913 family protein [Pantoea vagans]MDE8558912.1 DUF2913 family protein [Pantoea vagans]MDE8578917.1 DUF2913 family protein [Pantoea vagans]